MKDRKVAIITGGTSGIGLATAEKFSQMGWEVYSFARKEPTIKLPENATFVKCDVTDSQNIRDSLEDIYDKEGRIDLLISNAGFGISGPVEFTEEIDAKRILDTNFMGGFLMVKEAIKYMRDSGGRILFTSSIAAIMPIPFQSFYSSTKAAINLMAGALDNEVKPFGIRVSVVMPGDVKTEFTAAREKSFAGEEYYGEQCRHSLQVMEHDELNGMMPSEIADVFYKAAVDKHPKPWYVPGFQYKLVVLLYRLLPAKFVYWLLGKIYIG